ncbi:MAG: hypothetical protein IJT73_02575, partial [Selenomonadaceae bacterium]|nr:hypothetical protein [Selenomonadaceae bacterium]
FFSMVEDAKDYQVIKAELELPPDNAINYTDYKNYYIWINWHYSENKQGIPEPEPFKLAINEDVIHIEKPNTNS